MRRIEYPSDLKKLKKDYLSFFKLKTLQKEWTSLRNDIRFPFLMYHYPKRITRILLADYSKLIAYYRIYQKQVETSGMISETDKKYLKDQLEKKIFRYDNGYQSDIAAFFMRNASDLKISSCYYCEAAYINAYTVEMDAENLNFLNYESFDKLKKKLKIKDASIKEIIDFRNKKTIDSIDDFQMEGINRKWWVSPTKLRDIFPKTRRKNHFDLDHALDKGSCPILALSLMNLVPSCQVCNEKLKGSVVLGDRINRVPKTHLSPSARSYDFDEKVKFVMKPRLKPDGFLPDLADAVKECDNFELDFDIKDNDFIDFIELFHLKERYSYHKVEGLAWIQKKERYPDRHIDLMVSGLRMPQFTRDRIKEDIFHMEYDKERKPCFSKLKKDCLNP